MEEYNYIGVKLIAAIPMNRADYNTYRRWTLPDDEDGTDGGYLVEYLDGGQANDSRHKGYISWSPEAVFKKAYRLTDGMSFGLAIEAAKKGMKIARKGWNGKGIYVFLAKNVKYFEDFLAIDTHGLQTDNAAAPKCIVPWFPSQTDMLADDWMVIE